MEYVLLYYLLYYVSYFYIPTSTPHLKNYNVRRPFKLGMGFYNNIKKPVTSIIL